MFQSIAASSNKFGFNLLYRCNVCFRNVFEDYQWLGFSTDTNKATWGVLKCPFCDAEIDINFSSVNIPSPEETYILQKQTGTWQYMFVTDQSVPGLITITFRGTNTKLLIIDWGDGTIEEFTMTGGDVNYDHTYSVSSVYPIKFFIAPSDFLRITCNSGNLTFYFDLFNNFPNLQVLKFQNNNFLNTIPPVPFNIPILGIDLRNNNFTGPLPNLAHMPGIYSLNCNDNNFSGSIPDYSNSTLMNTFYIRNNNLSGSVPAFGSAVSVMFFDVINNNLSGSFPSVSSLTNLRFLYGSSNSFSGAIPDFSSNTLLYSVIFASNSFTGYSSSSFNLALISFNFKNNALNQLSVDNILEDFNTNLAGRPGAGNINLAGGTNSTPSAQGLIWKANIIAHGWTVLTN